MSRRSLPLVRKILLPILAWALFLPQFARAQVLATDGTVEAVESNLVRIDLVSALDLVSTRTAFLGAPVSIFERKLVGDRFVDVLVATLKTWKGNGDTLYVVAPFGGMIPQRVAVGHVAVVEWPENPGIVEFDGATNEVSVSWGGGYPLGRSPLFLRVYPDAYAFRFSKDCFEPADESISVAPGESFSAGPALRRARTPKQSFDAGTIELNGIDDENARAARTLLTSALNTSGCGGELEPEEQQRAEYFLDCARARIELVEYATSENRTPEQIQEMLSSYVSILRQTENLPPDAAQEGLRIQVENLHKLMPDFPWFAEMYRLYGPVPRHTQRP